jgi:hypothetical protein
MYAMLRKKKSSNSLIGGASKIQQKGGLILQVWKSHYKDPSLLKGPERRA